MIFIHTQTVQCNFYKFYLFVGLRKFTAPIRNIVVVGSVKICKYVSSKYNLRTLETITTRIRMLFSFNILFSLFVCNMYKCTI